MNNEDEDKPYMAIDNSSDSTRGRLYVAWTDLETSVSNPGYAIYIAYSNDSGKTWPKDTVFPGPSHSSGNIVQGAVPAVGPDGTVYVAYYSGSTSTTGGSGSIEVAMSTNSGNSFTTSSVITFPSIYGDLVGKMKVSSFPTIGVDPVSGYIYLAWAQDDGGNFNVYFIRSTTPHEITNWATPYVVNQASSDLHFFPQLTVNPEGVISLTYYQGNASAVDVYTTESFNQGESFDGFNTRVTSASSDPNNATVSLDYMGISSAPDGNIFELWTSFSSNSQADIYFAQLNGSLYSGGTVAQTLTIPAGETLGIERGSTTEFQNQSGLVVNGTLVVDGTASQPVTLTSSSGNWNGITFTGSSTGNLQDCTISYASSPVIIDTANMTINGCTINHSSFYGGNGNTAAAIQVWDANPTIENTAIDGESDSWNGMRFANGSIGTVTGCTIQNLGAGNGIVIQGASSPSILSCRITGNYYYGIIANTNTTGDPVFNSDYIDSNGIVGGSKYYQGILLNDSYAHINLDTVSNSNVGILCGSYSSPTSGQAGENVIIDNNTGIDADTYSSPVFGHAIGNPPVTYDGTCNQIYSNASENLYATNNSSIVAEYNWWGQYPPGGNFYADGTSSLDISNPLTSPSACPSGGSPTIATNSTSSNATATPAQIALWDEDACNWKQAAAEYAGILRDTSSVQVKRYALERLYHVFEASKDTTMIATFQAIADSTGPLTSMAQEILARAYLGAGRLPDAEAMANNLLSQHPGTGIAQRALILLASLYQYNPSYSQVSSTALAELKKDVANTQYAGIIPALTMGSVNTSSSSATAQNRQVTIGNDSTSSAPLKFELGNYPNPFNPTTLIRYEIPKDTHVTIRVYDVLGREVATLVDGNETAGVHEVTFDGSRFASGVYFYRLTTPGYSKVQKMILIK